MAARLGAQNTPAVWALVKLTPRLASLSIFGVMAQGVLCNLIQSFMSSTARNRTLAPRQQRPIGKLLLGVHTGIKSGFIFRGSLDYVLGGNPIENTGLLPPEPNIIYHYISGH